MNKNIILIIIYILLNILFWIRPFFSNINLNLIIICSVFCSLIALLAENYSTTNSLLKKEFYYIKMNFAISGIGGGMIIYLANYANSYVYEMGVFLLSMIVLVFFLFYTVRVIYGNYIIIKKLIYTI